VELWQHGVVDESSPLAPLFALRQHQQAGVRSPHKPLLVLLALGRLDSTGSSSLPWSEVESQLADLIADYGPPSRTGSRQGAAYPFTRLRSDGVWVLDHDVPMDRVGPLNDSHVVGQFTEVVESSLRTDRPLLLQTARALVEAEFPPTLAPDVLAAVGFDPDTVYGEIAVGSTPSRRRSAAWPAAVLTAWDKQCAFCGFDGQLGSGSVGLEAAHVRWFNFDGPDEPDNGMALCALHHKLFDRGALGLTVDLRLQVSPSYTARTEVGRQVYALTDRSVRPRPGSPAPATQHVRWHLSQVFKAG
jgi:putative restriction endonuclease